LTLYSPVDYSLLIILILGLCVLIGAATATYLVPRQRRRVQPQAIAPQELPAQAKPSPVLSEFIPADTFEEIEPAVLGAPALEVRKDRSLQIPESFKTWAVNMDMLKQFFAFEWYFTRWAARLEGDNREALIELLMTDLNNQRITLTKHYRRVLPPSEQSEKASALIHHLIDGLKRFEVKLIRGYLGKGG
jgi:hypothetical protein